MKTLYFIDPDNFKGNAVASVCGNDDATPEEMTNPYTGETYSQVAQRLGKNHITVDFDQLYKEYIKPYIESRKTSFTEIDKETYYYFLEVLPPLKWHNLRDDITIFFVSEAETYNLHQCFIKVDNDDKNRYFNALRTIHETDEAILKQFVYDYANIKQREPSN